jgi:AraC-like DNA-binding protein
MWPRSRWLDRLGSSPASCAPSTASRGVRITVRARDCRAAAYLSTAPAVDYGWTAALTDPVLAPALALLHRAPDHKWTVSELARAAAVSRSLLDGRFQQVLGLSPIRYLTEWRMRVARQARAARLRVTDELAVLPADDQPRRCWRVPTRRGARLSRRSLTSFAFQCAMPPSQLGYLCVSRGQAMGVGTSVQRIRSDRMLARPCSLEMRL